ncbi:hypothetical protein FE810_10650 [Thalassotalea litorea]|uniref:Uncharacterized protein n=1 Tax=Thalassotalea litorea TaxID=2020715 RepID=A0A5R9IHX8_9GAMM|nr:hypothetical protein [Thalassotalea litorea]TLU64902.1 hypothetical protein FE810_10650 [Thalassotalea litorea]
MQFLVNVARVLVFTVVVAFSNPVVAQNSNLQDIPKSLQPWQSWVQADIQDLQCPNINRLPFNNISHHICAWNSPLILDLNTNAGEFSQRWLVLNKESWVALPGDNWVWPENVTANQKTVAVVRHQGRPHVLLPKGDYQIRGEFHWQHIPKQLGIPPQTALFELSVNGDKKENLRLEGGELWLGAPQLARVEANEMTIDVTRLLEDGPYLSLTTLLTLKVYGQAREENLGQALPEGFTLTGIESDLPTYLDGQGQLHIKALPGDWEVEIQARARQDQLTITRPRITSPWPEQEIWVYAPDESFRMSKITGPAPADTSQAILPGEWEELPGYLLDDKSNLHIDVSHRGMSAQIRNQLMLQRNLWLNFDGQGFTFRDHLTGKMLKNWRLSMPSPYRLESGQDQDGTLLVSQVDEVRGIENRYHHLDIHAQGQITSISTFNITGWQQSFDTINYAIQLPPSYRLFALFGADHTSNTWLDKWNLWNSFVVLLITGLIASLFNKPIAALSMIALVLIYHEPGAPVIAIGVALLFVALQRQIHTTRFGFIAKALAKTTVLIALLASAYFMATQLRLVVYPQLEHQYVADKLQRSASVEAFSPQALEERRLADAEYKAAAKRKREDDEFERIEVTESRVKRSELISRYQANAPLQAGSGRPQWRWNSYSARWNSPVEQGQQIHLLILSPTVYNLLRLSGLSLLLLMLYLMLKNSFSSGEQVKNWLKGNVTKSKAKGKSVLGVGLLGLLTMATSLISEPLQAAGFPDQQLLLELQKKLAQPEKCDPDCATVQSVDLVIDKQQLTLVLNVHAIASVAIALPSSPQWRAQQVLINDQRAKALLKRQDKTYIMVAAGIHQIELKGEIFHQDTIAIRFDERPQTVRQKVLGWEISGVHRNKLTHNTLELIPKSNSEQQQAGNVKQRIKPFVKVNRRLYFDENWRLETEVQRVAPSKGAINVNVALLPQEKVFSAGVVVKDNQVNVTMSAAEDSVTWHSNIPRVTQFAWQAADNDSYIEQWRIIASPSWTLSLEGVPQVLYEMSGDDYFEFNFLPQRGETLTFNVSRPEAVQGEFLAIDNAKIRWMPGKRLAKLELEFDYRSTKAAQHRIDIPPGYELTEALTDGRRLQLQLQQQQLVLPISPGQHNYRLAFSHSQELTLHSEFPVFDLKVPVSNIKSQMPLNGDRWLLFTSGPSIGPAVVYWSELVVFVLAALLLSKLNFAPLSLWQWLLLGLGISTNNWSVFIMIVLTFAALRFYQRPQNESHWRRYNLGKIGITLLAIATLIGLVGIIPVALLSAPDMGIVGNQSHSWSLNWFSDKSAGLTPQIWVLSLPILVYKAVMLLWVMWLSFTFIRWVKWGWKRLTDDGFMMAKPIIVKADTPHQTKTSGSDN